MQEDEIHAQKEELCMEIHTLPIKIGSFELLSRLIAVEIA
jgi:hypothetical protein